MLEPQPTDPLIGTKIGSYTVERRLGEGGMGAVYEIVHHGIGKRLALKLLHAQYSAQPQIVERFFAEARAVNLIRHPNIVDIIDFAQLPDGRSYLTMEFLEGMSLAEYIRNKGIVPLDEVRTIALSICSALGAAHAVGIVHRDLKPENVHLVPHLDNPLYVKVLDFGIAKLDADLHTAAPQTRSGVVMGTPRYMSPEQAMGRVHEIDHRTDIYALGIIVYEMLIGKVPFAADSFGDLMLQHLQQPPQPVRELRPETPQAWNDLVQIALAKRREERFQSMEEFSAAIKATLAGSAPGVTPANPAGADAATVIAKEISAAARQAPFATTPLAAGPVTAPTRHPASSRRVLWAVLAGALIAAATVAVILFTQLGGNTSHSAVDPQPDAVPAATTNLPPDAAARALAAPPDAQARVPVDAAVPLSLTDAAVPAPRQVKSTRHGDRVKSTGSLVVTVTPWAEVLIDGKSVGTTPVTVSIPSGRHKVRIRNPELGKQEDIHVKVEPGKPTQLQRAW